MANESTKWLYRQLTDKGYNVGKDYAEFDNLMQTNADSRKWAYDTATKEGYNVGADFNEFEGLVAPSLRADSVTDGRGGFAQPAPAGSSAAPAESSLRSNTGQAANSAVAGPTRADVIVPESSIAGPKRADMNGNAAPAVSIEEHAARRLAPSPYQTIMDGILPTEETIKARNEAIARRAADNFANGQTTDTDPLGMKLATRQQEVNQANAEAKAMGAPARRSLDMADRLSRGDEALEYDRWKKATQQQQRDQFDEAEQALEAAWEERMKTIDQDIAQVKEAIKERQAVVDKERGPKALVADMGGTAHWDEELMNLNRRLDILRETKHRYERGKDSKDKNWLWNTWYGIADGSVELIKNPLGLKGAADSMAVYRVNEKAKRGEPLTEAEQQLLDAYGLKLQTEQYAQPLGAAYQIGGGVPAVVEMAAEFGLAPGAGMARSAWGAAANASMKQFDKALVRAMGKSIVEGMSISSTTQLGKNVKSALDRTMSAPVYNDKGELTGFEGESLIESLLKTGFQSTASNAVFLVHSPLAKSVYAKSAKQSGEKAAKSGASFAERHPKVAAGFDRIGRWIEGFNGGKSKVIPFNNPVDGFIKMKASEVAPILMGDSEWEDWVDPEQNAMLIGQLLTMEFTSGAYGSARAGINRMSAKSRMRKAYQTARDAFKDAKEPDEAIGTYMRSMLESSDGKLARELGEYRALALKNLSDKAVEAHPSLRSDTKQTAAQNAPDAPLTAVQADALIDLARATYGYLGVQSPRLGNDDVYRKSMDFYSRTNGKVWKDVRSDMNSLLHTAEYEALEKAYVDAASEQVTDAEGNPVPLERRRHEAAMEYRYAIEEASREFFGMESVDDIGEVQESVRRFINNRVGEWHDYDELLYRINTSKDMSREQKEAAKAFLFAERKMAGSKQLLVDQMAEARREQARHIDERTHTDGYVREVTLRDGRKAFVKSGTLVTREVPEADGNVVREVDYDKSHSAIVVREPETGKTEMIDPHDIAEVAAPVEAKAMLKEIAGETEKAFRDEYTAQMSGSAELTAGSEHEVLLDNGSFEKARVVDVEPSLRSDTGQAEAPAGDAPAEQMVVLEFSDGSRLSMPEKDVAANVRYAKYERYRQKRLSEGSDGQSESAEKPEPGESANIMDATADGNAAVPATESAPAASPAPVKAEVAAGDIIRIGGKDAHVADMRNDIVTVWTTDKLNENSYTDRDTPGYYTSLNRSELDSMADRDADGNIVGTRADRERGEEVEGNPQEIAPQAEAPSERNYVKNSEGSDDFGYIDISKANALGTGKAAPIRLQSGTDNFGRKHMEKHLPQLKANGYDSVEEFAEDVAGGYTEIRQGNLYTDPATGETKETYLLVKPLPKEQGSKGGVLYIECVPDGDVYVINSGGVFKNSYINRRKELWNASTEHSTTSGESQDFPPAQNKPESDGVSALSRSSFDGKVTNSASEKQEIGAESSPRAIDRLPRNAQGDPVWDAPEVDAPTTWAALNEMVGSKDRASNMLVKQQQHIADEIDKLAKKEPRYKEPAAKGDINAMLRAESDAREKYQHEHKAWEADMAELQRRAAHWREVAETEREAERQEQARQQAEADELRRRAQESERREAEQREAERERSRIEHERQAEEDRRYFEANRERIEAEQRQADEAEQRRLAERENLTEEERLAWEAEKRGFDKKLREVAEEVRDSEAALDILRDTTPQSIDEVAAMLLSSNKVVWKSEYGTNGTRVITGADAYSGLGESERRKLMGMWAGRDKGGISIDKLAEDKFKELCQEFGIPYDNAEARDALIDMIRTSATRGSITNYIAERRIEQARRQAELERQYEEAQIEQAEREDGAALRSHTEQPEGIDNESVEQLGRALPDEEVPFHRGGAVETDPDVYEAGVGLLKSSGIPVVEVGNAEAQAVLDNHGKDTQLMGSRTDRKMGSISRHFEGRELDANTQAVVDVFSGKRDNVAIEVERADGKRRVVMRQGKEQKAGTKHSLYRHFETQSNYVTADDIAMIPEIIAKGERSENGNKIAYDYITEGGTRLRVTTEVKSFGREEITNFLSNRKPQTSENRRPLKGDTQSSARTSNAEVSDAKVENKFHIGKSESEDSAVRLKELDKVYLEAVERGDMETAQRMVNEAAERAGYNADSDYQGTSAFNGAAPYNGYGWSKEERRELWDKGEFEGDWTLGDQIDGIDNGDLEFRIFHPNGIRSLTDAGLESAAALREAYSNPNRKITVYRSVPSHVKEGGLRDGDWVTPSLKYAKENAEVHGWGRKYRIIKEEVDVEELWWDGNDINEWGYDSGRNMVYRNTRNNRKLLNAVTYDDSGRVIPLSKRFDSRKADVRYLRTPSGEVYGWTVGGKVYLNRDAMNPETPVHEYTHLWDRMVREQNSKLWERGKELLKQTELWREVENDPNYADLRGDEDAIASEVHSRLTGRDGARLLREMLDRAAQQGYVARAQATDLLGKIRQWMGDMFSALKGTLEKWSGKELKALTLEDFNKLTLRDLAKGVDPRKEGGSNGPIQLSAAMARSREDFDSMSERAVKERGIVMPGLNEAEVRIVDVPRHDFEGDKPIAAARKWAKENIVGEHTLIDSNGNEVPYTISGKSIDKYLSASAIGKSVNLGVHLSVLKQLPEVIGESIEAEVHADYLKGSDGKRNPKNGYNSNKLIHRFYGMVEIDSKNYRVKTTIEESRTPGEKIKSHSFEVTNIELLPEDNSPMKVEPTASGNQGQLPHGTAKLLNGVEKSYDSGVKLLEASENNSENIVREPAVGRRSRKVAGVSLFDRRADEGVQGSLFDDVPTDAEPGRSLVERARDVAHAHDADKANGVIEGYAERYMEYADGMERRDRRMAELEQEIEQRRAAGEDTLEAETELEALRDEATLEDSSMNEHQAEAVAQLGEFYRRLGNTPEDADRMAIDRAKQTRAEVEIRRAQLASRRRLEEEIPSLRSDAEQAMPTEGRGNDSKGGPIEAVVTTAGGDHIGVTSMGALPKLKEGDFALVERRFIADGMFTFDGKQRIESVDDVAYIFRKLEDFAQEHSFVVMQRADGSFKVVHTGMGNAVSTIVDMGAVRAAYEAFGADKIWFVHNHPSGTLEFSRADESLIRRIQSAFAGDVSDVDAIIINTRSGKYITYNEREKGNTTDSSSESEVGVELFGGKKFADDYNADGLTRISGSSSIADYVAQLRLGDGVKSGYLILDNGNKVMANIVINGEPEPGELAREMVSATLRYGGKRVVRYSNGDNSGRLGGSELMKLKNQVQRISMDEVSLLDNVDMRGGLHDGGNYSSAFDNGLLHDSEAAYGSEVERAEKIRRLKPIEVKPNNLSRDELRNKFRKLQDVNKNGKKIRYLRNTFGKNYKEGGLFAQVVPQLDSILRESVLAYSEADNLGGTRRPDGTMHKSHPNVISFDNYVGKAIINGKEYYVRQTVQNTRDNSTGVHSCFVSDVALYENTAQGGTDSTILRRPNQSQGGIVDAKLQQFFERASSRGSKSSENFVNDPGAPATAGGGAGPMSAKERVMAYMLELDQKAHERGEVRNAGMAALGKMSRRVEKAMRLQQQYDAALLADVTGIARSMMGAGLIDSRSRLEVSRTMAAMRSAVSDTDIKECARRLMNVAASSQLRILSDNFEKLVRIKARKKDAHGVSVAGSLDFAGQEMLEAFNEGRGMSSVEPLGDRINEIENRLETADGNAKEIMQARHLGFELAMRYKELVSTTVDNELELKSQLEYHKGTWKECANEAERRDYREKKASLEENLRDEQMKAADALRELTDIMFDQTSEARERLMEFRRTQDEHRNAIYHNVNSDLEGRAMRQSSRKLTGFDHVLNSALGAKFLLKPLGTFEQMMREFGRNSINGEGYLFDRFVRGWQECRDKQFKQQQQIEASLDEQVRTILGEGYKRWSDVYKLSNKKAGTLTWSEGKHMEEHDVTEGQLVYIYMVNKMPDGRMKLRHMGIDEAKVNEIEARMDPKLKALADWMQQVKLPELREVFNDTHIKVFGSSMADIDDYFPIRILPGSRLKNVVIDENGGEPTAPTTVVGAIRNRTKNACSLDILNCDAFSVMLDHVRTMTEWNNFAQYNKDLGTLLSYNGFTNKARNMRTVYGSGDKFLETFKEHTMLVGGAYKPKTGDFNKGAMNLLKLGTGACITFRISTAIKQLLSAPAFNSEARADDMAYCTLNSGGSVKWCMQNLPAFERRWKDRLAGNEILRSDEADWNWTNKKWFKKMQRAGITPNAAVDAYTCAIGARAVYRTKLRNYLKEGFDQATAHSKACSDAEIAFNLSQQSGENMYLSTMQNDRNFLTSVFTVFRNSPMSYARQTYQSARELYNSLQPGGKERQLAFETKKLMREGLTEDQAQYAARKRYYRNLTRNTFKFLDYAALLPALWAWGLSGMWYSIFGDDPKKKLQHATDALLRGCTFGWAEGFAGGGTLPDVFFKGLMDGEWKLNLETVPAATMFEDCFHLADVGKTEQLIQQVVNTVVSIGIGVNPQVLEDVALAGVDIFTNENDWRDYAIMAMRIIQAPQSQIDQVYLDKIGMSAAEAKAASPAELAERYAIYKMHRQNFVGLLATDAERRGEMQKDYQGRFEKIVEGLHLQKSESEVLEALEKARAREAEFSEKSKRAKEQSYVAMAEVEREKARDFGHQMWSAYKGGLNVISKEWLRALDGTTAAKAAEDLTRYRVLLALVLECGSAREAQRYTAELNALNSKYAAMKHKRLGRR